MNPVCARDHTFRASLALRERPVVFVVDDDVSVRESLELLVRYAGWRPEVFSSAQDFLSRSPSSVPHCLVLDFSLPDVNGLDLQALVANQTATPIIFITAHGSIPMSVQAMKAGAVEFLTKPFSDEVLLTAIRQAIEHSRSELIRRAEWQTLNERFASLTPRERQVFTLVVNGQLNKQTAGQLEISEITVKVHRGKLMRKMRAKSLPDLVRMAEKLRPTFDESGSARPHSVA